MPQLIGVVLAGGVGRRVGSPKGTLQVAGIPMAERAARTLQPLCGAVVVSVAPGGVHPAPGYGLVEDALPAGRGPLAGIDAVMRDTGQADLLVLACDYAAVTTDFLAALLKLSPATADVAFPVDRGGRDHPLLAVWRRSAEGHVREALEAGHYKVRSLLAELTVMRLRQHDLPGFDLSRMLVNVNTVEELEGLGPS